MLTILGIVLIGFRIRVEERTFNLRLSRGFIAGAYFMLAISLFLSFFYAENSDSRHIEIITPAVSALQSMFFTYTLLSILQPTYVTRRQILWHITIISGTIILYLATALSIENYRLVVNIGVLSYICLLFFYTRLFIKKYALSLKQLEDYYDEDEQGRLSWVKTSFFAALSIGVIASVSTYFPIWIDYWFVISYLVFYTWFVIRFSNYVTKIDFYLSATTSKSEQVSTITRGPEQLLSESPTEKDSSKEAKLKNSLEQWVLNEEYMRGDISTEEIVNLLGTDLTFFRGYFRDHMSSDFRTWRIQLRIRKAQELIADYPEVSLNQIAQQVGFVSRSNFYLYFKKITGQSPADYRDQIAVRR
ncbi:MAG: helix-turn-helix domain-containing protein [Fermentimonas sp.]